MSRGRILDSILAALRETGKDLARLKSEDLAPVDEFHIRGREGDTAKAKSENIIRNLDEGRCVVCQAVAEKR